MKKKGASSWSKLPFQPMVRKPYLWQVVGRDQGEAVDSNLMNAVHSLKHTAHPLETLADTQEIIQTWIYQLWLRTSIT